jgi:hypothetical protein
MSPYVAASLISSGAVLISAGVALAGVVITVLSQTRHIDKDNRAALATQTQAIKDHVTETAQP